MKKIISLLLTALMLLSAFSVVGYAEEVYEGLPFTDVKEGAWYYEGIEFCYFMGYVSGMTETTFEPNGTLTRAQFVQILAMYDGVELEAYKNNDSGFDDVKPNHWFNAPVCWAVEQGFVAGLSADRFGPNEKITREQLARLLYLYAEARGYDVSRLADLSGYTDKPSDWAYEQVQWAVAAGIISGMTETTIAPRASATRAQACRMIMSYFEFECYGYRDMSGAYAVIVEYIKANGDYFSEEGYYSYFAEYEGYDILMEYVESDESISIAYLTEPYEIVEGEDVWVNYRESAGIYAYTLGYQYDFYYYYEDANGTDYMNSFGYMSLDGYEENENQLEGYENTELIDRVSNGQAYIREHIALILAEADMTLEDFFLPYEAESAVFADLAALIMANGATDGKGWYKYGCASYDENENIFTFYLSDSVLSDSGMSTKNNNVYVFVEYPATEYYYECQIHDFTDETGLMATLEGVIGNGYVNVEADITYGESEVIYAIEEELRLELLVRIEAMLAECGHTLDELFLASEDGGDADDEMQELYDALVRYICDEGVEYPDGKHIGLITDNGDEAYVTEYVPETGEICLVYVTEPIPGGTDIFDTSYRERVIFIPDILTGSLWWQYTYESEDGTVKISATGTDADEDNYANLTFEGISEEDAKAKFDVAMENTVFHFLGLMVDAASYIAYDAVADHVNSNGVAFAGGIDLVKDEGDRGYVAEYDAENDDLYFIYVSEPIPGGNDIFDTSYREKAIIMFDPPLADEYFIYTYESEDGSVKLNAEGFYDGFEVAFDSFEFAGLSEEEAVAKITNALDEALGYYYELLELAMPVE